jgi:hypothetical protein
MQQPYGSQSQPNPQLQPNPHSYAQPHAPNTMGSPAHQPAPAYQVGQSAPPPKPYSVPPPSAPLPQQGPNTHMSVQRPGATLTSGSTTSPAVEIMTAPPVGVPWWVVGAVGAACLVLGFIAGFLAN